MAHGGYHKDGNYKGSVTEMLNLPKKDQGPEDPSMAYKMKKTKKPKVDRDATKKTPKKKKKSNSHKSY